MITEQTFHIIILLKYENKRQAICKWARPNNKYSVHLFAHGNKWSPTQKVYYTNRITIRTSETSDGCARELLSKEEEEEYATTRKVRLETISNSKHLSLYMRTFGCKHYVIFEWQHCDN